MKCSDSLKGGKAMEQLLAKNIVKGYNIGKLPYRVLR